MTPEEQKIRYRLKHDAEHFAAKCLKIKTNSGVVPFLYNKTQRYLMEVINKQRQEIGKVRQMFLKGRQQGVTTQGAGLGFQETIHNFGFHTYIMAHQQQATNNIFRMVKRFYDNCPNLVKPVIAKNNAKELIFKDLDSSYFVGTAGNKALGRSQAINFLHWSEVAYSANAAEHGAGILQAVPNLGSTVLFESTANGIGNYFHDMWLLAKEGGTEFQATFVPWYWKEENQLPLGEEPIKWDEYELWLAMTYSLTPEQLNWRRQTILILSAGGVDGNKKFKQEYPCEAAEAFQFSGYNPFIEPDCVARARKQQELQRIGPLIVGVDPARSGRDRTCIVFRQGRVAFDMFTYRGYDNMQVAGVIHTIIEERTPACVAIDVGGIGSGIVDRLRELGHSEIVKAINFGGKPTIYPDRFPNKRCEIWGLMRDWLLDEPVKIPDSDSLHSDLCISMHKCDSNGRLVMEPKDDMIKRLHRSPDEADALALTFAHPVTMNSNRSKVQRILNASRIPTPYLYKG